MTVGSDPWEGSDSIENWIELTIRNAIPPSTYGSFFSILSNGAEEYKIFALELKGLPKHLLVQGIKKYSRMRVIL